VLEDLEAVGAETEQQRRARFRTVVLIRWADGSESIATGTVEGHIALAPKGSEGFGYDPIFVPDEGSGQSFAQMTSTEKHAISHRGRALRALAQGLS
jgi:XTP/dITP diphosphohydrolase